MDKNIINMNIKLSDSSTCRVNIKTTNPSKSVSNVMSFEKALCERKFEQAALTIMKQAHELSW